MNQFARVFATVFVAAIIAPFHLVATEPARQSPQEERQVIETLITRLENLTGAQFVRNGKEYPPSTAGKFLRAKWKQRADEIKTAEDFIEKVGSRSSTTGRPYLVRYRDGSETPTKSLLHLELQRIRTNK